MASVMATESEVFSSCVGDITVSMEEENRGVWLCYGMSYLRFILLGNAAQDWRSRWVMVPVIRAF